MSYQEGTGLGVSASAHSPPDEVRCCRRWGWPACTQEPSVPSLHLLCKSKLSPNTKRFEMRVHARGPIKVVNCSQLFNLGWEWGFPGGASGNEPKSPSASAAEVGDAGSVLAGKIPWRRRRQPAPVFLPGESHGQRSLAGHSP